LYLIFRIQVKCLTALGPLGSLYADPDVLEIMVDSPDRVLFERQGTLEDAGIRFDSPEALRTVIDATLALCGVKLEPGQTIADTRLSDARLLVVLPPTAPQGPYMVIRKLPVSILTWDKLFEFGFITRQALDLLQSAIRAQINILIAGGTGSGKTTLANLLAESIPSEERLVIAEGAREFRIRHPRAVFLEAGGPANLSMAELLRTAAKMRPDWLVIGKMVGPEALHALEIMSRGHSGMTTIHANSPEDALARLEAMCLMANLGLGLSEIRGLIAAAFQLITYQSWLPDGKRRLIQITELSGLEHDRYVLQPLMRFTPDTDKLHSTGVKPGWE